jgi:hypothetical protein
MMKENDESSWPMQYGWPVLFLWVLNPIRNSPKGDPWTPWYDTAHGFVVRAESERNARILANRLAGDEASLYPDVWLDPEFTSCRLLTGVGEEEVVMRDFRAG